VQTHELIEALAADTGKVPSNALERRLGLTALAGAMAALVLVLAWLKLRPDLGQAAGGGFFWIKALYTAALGLAGLWATARLAQPDVSARPAFLIAFATVAAFAILGLVQFLPMDAHVRMAALRGVSWQVCSRNVVILAAPMLAMSLWALRWMAPTRPTLAGFAAGAFAGGIAATIYGLHCPEATFVFVALWYTLGVVASGVIGAVAGRFVLRW
jgi:hypothetical protein